MKNKEKYIEFVRLSTQNPSTKLVDILERHFEKVGVTAVDDFHDLEALVAKQPDLVFLRVKKVPTRDHAVNKSSNVIWVSEYLDEHGINYTGSTAAAMALDVDKPRAKQVIKDAGLVTAEYFIARLGEFTNERELPLDFPLFIKPTDTGNGFGIDDDSVVRNFAEFDAKLRSLAADSVPIVLVEKYLSGREFTVAVLQDAESDTLSILPTEKTPTKNERGDRLMGFDTKATTETPISIIEDVKVRQAAINLARDAFIAIGARDYGRIDMRLDDNNIPNFLEANLTPYMVDGSGNFPKAYVLNTDKSYEEMILHIVNLAFAREADLRQKE